jgi:hypothetical protein
MERKRSTSRRRYKQHDGFQSEQEELFVKHNPQFKFKPAPIEYVSLRTHLPDVLLGCRNDGKVVYIELKEWMALDDCRKYEDVVKCHPGVCIYFLIVGAPTAVMTRLAKNPAFKVHNAWYTIPAEWLVDLIDPTQDDLQETVSPE